MKRPHEDDIRDRKSRVMIWSTFMMSQFEDVVDTGWRRVSWMLFFKKTSDCLINCCTGGLCCTDELLIISMTKE